MLENDSIANNEMSITPSARNQFPEPQKHLIRLGGMVLMIVLVFVVLFLINSPGNAENPIQTGTTPTPTEPAPTATSTLPYPPELLENSDQTNGIVLGGVLLVLIIVGGTLSVISRKDRN